MAIVNPFRPLLKKTPPVFKNRFWAILIVFFIWMIVFDRHDMITQFKLDRTLNKMKEDKIYYINKLSEVKQERIDMESNKEKFAREHYFMKAPNEDIFVIQKEEK